MTLDFAKIISRAGDTHLVPRDIFDSLPSKSWPRLRLEQGEVLKEWFERRSERDLVIEQNTGGGKTVVGLLAAQSSLNEGVGPAVYLVPDTFLVTKWLRSRDSAQAASQNGDRIRWPNASPVNSSTGWSRTTARAQAARSWRVDTAFRRTACWPQLRRCGVVLRPPGRLSLAHVDEMRRWRQDGWTYAAIGDRFGVTRSAVKLRLARRLAKLVGCLVFPIIGLSPLARFAGR